jgi:hypothetical protein
MEQPRRLAAVTAAVGLLACLAGAATVALLRRPKPAEEPAAEAVHDDAPPADRPARLTPPAPGPRPDILELAARLRPEDFAHIPDPRDLSEADQAAWRRKLWAALYSPDPRVWQAALDHLPPALSTHMDKGLLDLARRAEPLHRAVIACRLALGAYRAKHASEGSDLAPLAEALVAADAVACLAEGLSPEIVANARAWQALDTVSREGRRAPPAEMRRLMESCIGFLDQIDPRFAQFILGPAVALASWDPVCRERLVGYVRDHLRRDPAWRLRAACVEALSHLPHADDLCPVLEQGQPAADPPPAPRR